MLSRKVAITSSMLICMLVATGCGKVDLVSVDPTGGAGSNTGNPSLNRTPVVVAPTPAPQPTYNPPLPVGKFEAKVTKCDCQWYKLGVVAKTAYVEVKNPTTVPLKGKVKLQFTDDGSPLAEIAVDPKDVELGPGETQNLTFAGKGTKIDGASVTVQMDGETATGAPIQAPATGVGGGASAASVYGTPPGLGR